MTHLIDYIDRHAHECQPTEGDTDVIFFGVKRGPDATAEGLIAAIEQHKGEFAECNPLDCEEHGYPELGQWLGDQEAALKLIGLGSALGLWKLLTPKTVLGDLVSPEQVQEMARGGMVTMRAFPK